MTILQEAAEAGEGGGGRRLPHPIVVDDDDDDDNSMDGDIVEWFEGVAENAGAVQARTLRRIIELNRGAEYLRKWLGDDVRVSDMDPAELEALYTSAVPLASHADMEPYIQRIADGDSSPVLTKDPITMLSLSSGTTDGRPKYVPFTRFSSQSTLQIFPLAAAYRSRVYPIRAGGRVLEFLYSSKQFKTKGGLTAGTATTHYYASEEFTAKQRTTGSYTCSPYEVIAGGDYKQSTYCHLLLGLAFSQQVEFVASTFAYSLVQAFAALEELWEDLCADLGQGTLSSAISSPEMRRAVLGSSSFSASPELATGIEHRCRELKRSGWRGLIPALWPNAKYVYSIMTGSMQPYLSKLRHYAGGVALVGADYGSTESWIGVNLEPANPPERVAFTLVPTFSYFEFIPLFRRLQRGGAALHHDDDQQFSSNYYYDPGTSGDDFAEGEPVSLTRVKVGQQYELVLTTFTGTNMELNIDKDLMDEKGIGACHAEVGAHHPGHYVVYWELKDQRQEAEEAGDDDAVLQECCGAMDAAFADHGYVVSRRARTIGPLELRVVERGTFRHILEHYIRNGAAMSQYKTPRCTTDRALLTILDRSTVKRFWSTAYG
ncbi:jasmonic acid-amido synthetase JAR2 [Ananas comosus]|uniref:Jasmonic acid-amido synthetase JAR2 n=1 Tax=Ananas comosus TaxID=4615 RepID=A0A6P5FNW1_ANACO|nr:jasmonic acid-amido synthetase JAR2 [Ananas comosus]